MWAVLPGLIVWRVCGVDGGVLSGISGAPRKYVLTNFSFDVKWAKLNDLFVQKRFCSNNNDCSDD